VIGEQDMDWVKEKMEHARQQRERLQGKSHTNTDQSLASSHESQTGTHKKPLNTILLLGATTAWIATLIAAWMAGSGTTTFDVSSNDPGNGGAIRVSEDAKLRNHIATSAELRKRLDDVNERIQLLTDAMPNPASMISSVDQQQPLATGEESVIEMIETIEPTAAGRSGTLTIANTEVDKSTVEDTRKLEAGENDALVSETLTVANTGPDKSAADVSVKHGVSEKGAPGSDKQDSLNLRAKSPWVVNLVSLSNKADADRFAARARSKDIQTERYAVTVKGKQYWRVHVSGFLTAAEANYQANIIKEKLGLKDVWITKR